MTDGEYRRLVEFLGERFAEVDGRFAEIDRRFSEIDRRFGDIDHRLAEADRRRDEQFREVLAHFDELYRRLERLESEYFAIVQTLRRIEALVGSERAHREALAQSVDQLRRQLADLQARLDAVEARLRG
jgi:chromosome segregation ATPase